MKLTTERITTSVQVFPTASADISGSAVVDMSQYRHAVVKLYAHRLPDQKGEGVITVSMFETTNSVLNGQEVAASVVTGSITSVSDIILQGEISTGDMDTADNYRYLYASVVSATPTEVAVTIERDEARYES
jgi:hypothetical protein